MAQVFACMDRQNPEPKAAIESGIKWRNFNGTKAQIDQRPYGLLDNMDLIEYRAVPVSAISPLNYKVNARIGASKSSAEQ